MAFYIYKPIGKTCGQMLEPYEHYKKKAYSGRLDPMAHGQMIILTDHEVKNEAIYHTLNKTYKFSFIIGIHTDTDDILGIIPNDLNDISNKQNHTSLISIIDAIQDFPDSYDQNYHKFSSFVPKQKYKEDNKRKPLWWWSERNIEILEKCSKKVSIHNKQITNIQTVSGEDLKKEFLKRLGLITVDTFRTIDIIKQFKDYNFNGSYKEITCQFSVSSGFYVRQFVKDLSDQLNTKLLVTDIERLKYE
jgi:tRNA U55 pseudouridine synthase TruB